MDVIAVKKQSYACLVLVNASSASTSTKLSGSVEPRLWQMKVGFAIIDPMTAR